MGRPPSGYDVRLRRNMRPCLPGHLAYRRGSCAEADPDEHRRRTYPQTARSYSVVIELSTPEGAGDEPEELPEHRCGGDPDGVAHELEEDDRALPGAEVPTLLPEDLGQQQLGESDVEDRVDLGDARLQRRPAGQEADVGDDERAARDRRQVVELADDLDRRRVESRLLPRLRSAVAARSASPGSWPPPGKLTSPLWARRWPARRVRTTQASPSSS